MNIADRYRDRIIERLDAQRNKGIKKYGQPLEQNPANIKERLEHLAQELTDGLEYIEWIKEAVSDDVNSIAVGNITHVIIPKLKQSLYQSHPHQQPFHALLAQALQVQEESGELAQKIGLLTGATGKRKQVPRDIVSLVAEEALDVAQAACGILFALQWLFDLQVNKATERHIEKMRERGYLE